MKTIVLYISYAGHTKALALQKARELGADIEEITEVKKPFVLAGLFRALKRGRPKIQPIRANLDSYDIMVLLAPVWAGHPVAPFNSLIECLPSGKKVEVIMGSSGGGTPESAEGTRAQITARGCEVTAYTDVKVSLDGGEVRVQTL